MAIYNKMFLIIIFSSRYRLQFVMRRGTQFYSIILYSLTVFLPLAFLLPWLRSFREGWSILCRATIYFAREDSLWAVGLILILILLITDQIGNCWTLHEKLRDTLIFIVYCVITLAVTLLILIVLINIIIHNTLKKCPFFLIQTIDIQTSDHHHSRRVWNRIGFRDPMNTERRFLWWIGQSFVPWTPWFELTFVDLQNTAKLVWHNFSPAITSPRFCVTTSIVPCINPLDPPVIVDNVSFRLR